VLFYIKRRSGREQTTVRKHLVLAALAAGVAVFSCRLMAGQLNKLFELQEEVTFEEAKKPPVSLWAHRAGS
jgi:hypothetical protein